jgi:hypothetical protein
MQGRVFCKFGVLSVWVCPEFKLGVLNWTMLRETNACVAERGNMGYCNAVVFLTGMLCQ